MIQHLIFDLNRTIDNFDTYGIEASRKVIENIFPYEPATDYLGAKLYLLIERYEKKWESEAYVHNIKRALRDFFAVKGISPEQAELEKLLNIFIEESQSTYRILQEFTDIVPELAKKYSLYLYTMSTVKEVEENFKTVDCSPGLFKKIYARENLIEAKPSISNLEMILLENNISPENCLIIGDDPVADIFPTKFLGIKTCLFCPHADIFLKDHRELQGKINKYL